MTAIHRIREVRQKQGVQLRMVERHLGLTRSDAREIEHPEHDLRVSELVKFAVLLNVPVGELLIDAECDEIIKMRGLVLRLCRIANTLLERAPNQDVRILAESIRNQIIEVMPQVDDQHGLLSVGSLRTGDEMGRIAEHPIHLEDWTGDRGEAGPLQNV